MATALVSAFTGIVPVRKDVAMTGEITLRGKVLPVGGIKDKLLAAFRAGYPRADRAEAANEKDLEEIPPEEVREKLELHLVESMDEVLSLALDGGLESASNAEGEVRRDYPRVARVPDSVAH